MKSTRSRRNAPQYVDPPAGLPVRQLRWVGATASLFAAIAAASLAWEQWFPTPPEKLVEVVWTHECECATAWIHALRREGFTVREFEMDELRGTRRQWHVPPEATGCHPGRFMNYTLDGHLSGDLLRRLAQEHLPAVAVLQARTTDPEDVRFELLARDGTRKAWP
jgi:hypothetical protein